MSVASIQSLLEKPLGKYRKCIVNASFTSLFHEELHCRHTHIYRTLWIIVCFCLNHFTLILDDITDNLRDMSDHGPESIHAKAIRFKDTCRMKKAEVRTK